MIRSIAYFIVFRLQTYVLLSFFCIDSYEFKTFIKQYKFNNKFSCFVDFAGSHKFRIILNESKLQIIQWLPQIADHKKLQLYVGI